MKLRWILLMAGLAAGAAFAGEPVVKDVTVEKVGMLWNVHVTLEHPDTGWDHYADGWEVLDKDGERLAHRELMHPHVKEQPFTRSISGVVIPDGTREIFIKPHCSVHGWADTLTRVELSP
ncbi:hypothetical protein A3731_19450 [Roseovarius sp. HI0049]|nr:hypothetical protein A3731_19450 [Roseovarius sp. HI0049]